MYSQIVSYCSAKKGAAEDYPFGPSPLVMKVGGKMFALISKSGEDERTYLSLKCDPIIAVNLREQHEAVKPGYHLNKKHWKTVIVDGSLSWADLTDMMDHSYDLVIGSLTKAARLSVLEDGQGKSRTVGGT